MENSRTDRRIRDLMVFTNDQFDTLYQKFVLFHKTSLAHGVTCARINQDMLDFLIFDHASKTKLLAYIVIATRANSNTPTW